MSPLHLDHPLLIRPEDWGYEQEGMFRPVRVHPTER